MQETYYKIIRNGNIVGCGHMWLRWFDRGRRFTYCAMGQANAVEDDVSGWLYRPDWLPWNDNAWDITQAEVKIIQRPEYDEIYESLIDGEAIPVPEEEDPPAPEPDPDDGEEQEERMSIQEMREKIMEQEDMIGMLEECLMEMSEIVYA